MLRLLTTVFVSGAFILGSLPSHAQRLEPPPIETLPSPSRIPSSTTTPSLGFGDAGRDVEALQRALLRNGIDPGPIDGDYGPQTRDAVSQFQQWYDLPVTGVAGPQTLDVLGVDVFADGDFDDDFARDVGDDLPYVAAVIESRQELYQVQRVFGNATIDSARQGDFINIGRYSSRSAAADRVREARRSGFEARVLYQR